MHAVQTLCEQRLIEFNCLTSNDIA